MSARVASRRVGVSGGRARQRARVARERSARGVGGRCCFVGQRQRRLGKQGDPRWGAEAAQLGYRH
eukprot:2748809-Lingulodinium_polyedra.AAC.1